MVGGLLGRGARCTAMGPRRCAAWACLPQGLCRLLWRTGVDARALAALRVALAALVLVDVASRLRQGRLALAWYTSEPQAASVLRPGDTPHTAWLHTLLFARGSVALQLALFGATAAAALCFGAGVGTQPLGAASCALWALVTAMHGRCEAVCDGSDHYLRAVLLWCCLLPMGQPLPLLVRRGVPGSESAAAGPSIVRGPEVTGLLLQMCFMYWGTVLHRLPGTSWWWPKLDAVYYALASNFATRPWAVACILPRPWLWRAMTAAAVATESLAPLALLLAPERRPAWRAAAAAALVSLHVGLLGVMRLFNWQVLAALVALVWLPPPSWDAAQRALSRASARRGAQQPKAESDDGKPPSHYEPHSRPRPPAGRGRVARMVAHAALAYMCYLWAAEQRWIPKVDDGNVGEVLRWNQYWVMVRQMALLGARSLPLRSVKEMFALTIVFSRSLQYGPNPPKETVSVFITAELASDSGRRVDVLRALRLGDWGAAAQISAEEYRTMRRSHLADMSERFPGPRWERALHRWGRREVGRHQQSARVRGESLARAVCTLAPIGLAAVEVEWRGARIMPPGLRERFERHEGLDERVVVRCE